MRESQAPAEQEPQDGIVGAHGGAAFPDVRSPVVDRPMINDTLYKIGQVAKRLNVAPNTVRNAIEAGHLFAYLLPGKGRGTYRVPESSIEKYLTEHVFRPPAPAQPKRSIKGRPFRHLVLDDESR